MSNWILGIVSGLVGLFMAAGAHDAGVYVFGIGLMAFSVLFCSLMAKSAFDDVERRIRGR